MYKPGSPKYQINKTWKVNNIHKIASVLYVRVKIVWIRVFSYYEIVSGC